MESFWLVLEFFNEEHRGISGGLIAERNELVPARDGALSWSAILLR
jgi:hypothetical protein